MQLLGWISFLGFITFVTFSSFATFFASAIAFCAETPGFFGNTPRDFCVVKEVGGNLHTRGTDTHGGPGGGQRTAIVG